jgi:ubiquinone/menaquinone biosynthesis C-methylase UbiE
VMSISSIDHFKDYKQFIAEANRITKPGGFILIASHLDTDTIKSEKKISPKELVQEQNNARPFKQKVFNRLAHKFEFNSRKFHNRKRGPVADDHMHHFENTQILEEALKQGGYQVEQVEVFQRNFFIKARKL